MYGKIIKKIIDSKEELSAAGLEKALGKSQSTINKILNDKRPIKLDEIQLIEKYLGQSIQIKNIIDSTPLKVVLIQVMGIIEHNVWRDRSNLDTGLNENIPAVPGYNLPGGEQIAFKVGHNLGKYQTGEYIICSTHNNIKSFIETGVKVVATVIKGDMIETGLYKAIKTDDGSTCLNKFDASDIVSMDDVVINGIVMATISPEMPLQNLHN